MTTGFSFTLGSGSQGYYPIVLGGGVGTGGVGTGGVGTGGIGSGQGGGSDGGKEDEARDARDSANAGPSHEDAGFISDYCEVMQHVLETLGSIRHDTADVLHLLL